jgi:hypothetical protein
MTNKITQDEFLNRIMTSDNSIQEAFTIHGLKALHNSLYKFYSHTFPKDFHVEILLRTWQEFDTLDTAKSYCQKNTRHYDPKDVIIFDTGVLLFQR